MLCPVGAKHSFSALKGHGMSAQGNAVNIPVRHALNVAVPLATPVIKRGIEFLSPGPVPELWHFDPKT